jgi:hypothetical protein
MSVVIDCLFGSEAGGWGNPDLRGRFSAAPFLTAGLLIPIVLVLAYFSGKRIRQHEWKLVGLWMLLGFGAQLWMRSLTFFSMSAIIESPGATSFYNVTQAYSAWDFLTNYHALVGALPLHARANMPGKTLLFYLLEMITSSTTIMGYLIILISNLGGVLTYLLTRQLFKNRLAALYAMIFYLFMPAKLYFFPILNTVTPVLMLLSLLLFVQYLNSKKDNYLLALGLSLYGLCFFEPLPLVTGLIFLALMGKSLLEGELDRFQLIKIFAYVPGSFFLMHLLLIRTLGFNILEAFSFSLQDARAFNVHGHRPYSVWVVHNLKDFFLNMGIAHSVLFLTVLGSTFWKLAVLIRQRNDTGNPFAAYFTKSPVLLLLAFTSVLLVLDLLGINRGETDRLWIFLGVILQIVVAYYCAVGRQYAAFAPVLAITIFQTTLCLYRIGFVTP